MQTTRARPLIPALLAVHHRSSGRNLDGAADRTEAASVVGTFQLPLEPTIAGMGEGDGPFNAGELDGEHQSVARARPMAGEALLETAVSCCAPAIPTSFALAGSIGRVSGKQKSCRASTAC